MTETLAHGHSSESTFLSTTKVASALEDFILYFLMDIYFHLVAALTLYKPRIIVVYIEDNLDG